MSLRAFFAKQSPYLTRRLLPWPIRPPVPAPPVQAGQAGRTLKGHQGRRTSAFAPVPAVPWTGRLGQAGAPFVPRTPRSDREPRPAGARRPVARRCETAGNDIKLEVCGFANTLDCTKKRSAVGGLRLSSPLPLRHATAWYPKSAWGRQVVP
jgi:hypothetical protein